MHFYETTDLNFSAALLTLGCNLLRLDRTNPRRVLFCFEKNDDIEVYADEYWHGSLRLPAIELFTQQKVLKQRLYSAKTSEPNTNT